MFEKIIRRIKLLIADIKWMEEQDFKRYCFGTCFPSITLDSYKPSFRAKHTPEEMEEIIRQDIAEVVKLIEELFADEKEKSTI